jgi:hypothetical protein
LIALAIPSTIREDIENNEDTTLSHRTFNVSAYLHYTKNDETIRIPMNHIVNKYYEYFTPYIITVTIDEAATRRYAYAPKMLSLDLYATVEYWSILLYINNCHSILDFHPEGTVKVVDPNNLTALVNEILILEDLV